jgi:coproporphyrinogen III oxidase
VSAIAVEPVAMRGRAVAAVERLHEEATALFVALDGAGAAGGARFREDAWRRPGGGSGIARVLADGATFEKAGVNRFVGGGALPPGAATRLGGRVPAGTDAHFFATGLSIVAHPRSPRIPTVHLNVRYFELTDPAGVVLDAWFGGGTDLTPMFPEPADAHGFHRALRALCDEHHPSLFPRFKPWCDEYFRNTHRDGEARGVGGIFFDHVRPAEDESGLDADALLAFVSDVGRSLEATYAPLVERHRDEPSGERERACQLWRRGRYVEFNLLHDRGTLFGLQTGARTESVLMSLPPVAAWDYAPERPPGSLEARLGAMLAPRDWASAPR